MELIDVLDENGNTTGKTIDKDKAHLDGIYHPVVHIVVLSKDRKRILLQKRCASKKICPNMWDVAAAGHIDANEDCLVSAKREFGEELGLDSNNYEFNLHGVFKEIYDNEKYKVREYTTLYIIYADIDIKDIKIQEDEVSEVKWMSREELEKLLGTDDIIWHEYYNYILNLMSNYFTFKELNNDKVMSLYSKKPLDFSYNADRETLFKNVEKDFNISFKKIVRAEFQAHGNEVVIINEDNYQQDITDVDGFLTDLKNVALEIRTADCQSILLYDPVKGVIGNVHSGWKGTYKQIIVNAINKMVEHYGCNVKDIIVGFNPSILGCCFEIKDDVLELFKEVCDVSKYSKKYNDGYLLDTVAINYDRLIDMGIKKEHIFLSNICTGCNTNEYHSYRKENKTEGRNISLICLK